MKRHVVSRDFVKWAYLPIAFWDGPEWYDVNAIFTGSITVVNGEPVWIYPGICNKSHPGCHSGTVMNIARPANASDPLRTYWAKMPYNPVINETQRDPSTAWQDPETGEWRFTIYGGRVYGSMDFKTWYPSTGPPPFSSGECPSFFPLPRSYPGTVPSTAASPGFVNKFSSGGQDWMNVGDYSSGAVKTSGTYDVTNGTRQLIDIGQFYASKDFWDPVKGRRINWGWAKVPTKSSQTLPREVTWHPQLNQLVFSPVEEQAELRGTVAGSHAGTDMMPNSTAALTPGSTNQTEILVTFAVPKTCGVFGVALVTPGRESSWFYIDFDATTLSAKVGQGVLPVYPAESTAAAAAAPNMTCARVQNNTCLTRAFPILQQFAGVTDVAICCAKCQADPDCVSWNVNRRSKICYTRGSYVTNPGPQCAAGVLRPSPPEPPPPAPHPSQKYPPPGKLQLLPTDTNVTLRLFVEPTFTEIFWQDGRVAMTATTPTGADTRATVYAGAAGATLLSATAWTVEDIWISPEDVLASPRRDLPAPDDSSGSDSTAARPCQCGHTQPPCRSCPT